MHAFLAVDRPEDGAVRRHARASRIVERAGFGAVLDPAALVGTADQLVAWVDQRWPGARWNREVPITALIETAHGRRRIEGVIDLLLTVPAGVVIVDHKTYPAPSVRAVADRAAAFLPQLAAYAEALEALGHHVVGACLHFPIGGIWADLRPA